jgi:hypothetical protein
MVRYYLGKIMFWIGIRIFPYAADVHNCEHKTQFIVLSFVPMDNVIEIVKTATEAITNE